MSYDNDDVVQDDKDELNPIVVVKHLGAGMVQQQRFKDPNSMSLEDFINEFNKEKQA
jgi:hypothetical protein